VLLELSGVSKTYHGAAGGKVDALREVSLRLDAGQFIAIRGPSGCGKSSLLMIAGTLLKPDSGDVILAGERPYEMSSDERAKFRAQRLGFVFQQFHLVPYLSVLENVLAATLPLPRHALQVAGQRGDSSQEATEASAHRRASELLQRFGLGDRLGHTPNQLSSGERQRCALARAMLNRPALLLADEPTGNLDSENAAIVLHAMREFTHEGGAVLLVTHDEHACAAADQTLQMSRGRFVSEHPVAM
jgi:putative ABC transport system ATP-binding protein